MSDFSFTPKTDQEIAAMQNRGLLAEGVYKFIVTEAKPMISQSGNSMIQLRLAIKGVDNIDRNVFDFLVSSEEMIFKIKHFCEAVGLESAYAAGAFNAQDCMGKGGNAKIVVQKGKLRADGSGFYPDKNGVRDYIKSYAQPTVGSGAEMFNDDLPF